MKTGVHSLANGIAALARGLTGAQVRWTECEPTARQRIYFANHSSHLDFVVLWSALPDAVRARTRPVAARDYWRSGVRGYLAQSVFRAVLIDRGAEREPRERAPEEKLIVARRVIEALEEALGQTDSLIMFPEGTRGDGENVAPFRSGLYYLARLRPDVELVPAYLENLSRILPKGEVLPVPLLCRLSFGPPLRIGDGEGKSEFLERAHAAVCALRKWEGL